ncbi:MAG TPA: cytochrome C oxidase subunit IV family protein [Thermoanaerobaculia bacterium]|jgi:cytochrome c oxidase subunit 4
MSGHIAPARSYVLIFALLMVFTAITVAVAFTNLGAFNFPVAISIAIVKATLVILFFMHVKYSSHLTKLIIGSGVFLLLVMFSLTMTDYLSRGWQTRRATEASGIRHQGSGLSQGSGGGHR